MFIMMQRDHGCVFKRLTGQGSDKETDCGEKCCIYLRIERDKRKEAAETWIEDATIIVVYFSDVIKNFPLHLILNLAYWLRA